MSTKSKQVLRIQARQIVAKVYDFMKKEAIHKYAENLTDARWRTAQAVGISPTTVTRILRERRANVLPQDTVFDMDEEDVQFGDETMNLVTSEPSPEGANDNKCETEVNSFYKVAVKIEPNHEEGSHQTSEIVSCDPVDVKCEFESDPCKITSKTDVAEIGEGLRLKSASDIKLEIGSDPNFSLTDMIEHQCVVKIEPADEESIQEDETEENQQSSKKTRKNIKSKDKSEQKCALKPDLTYHGGEKPYKCNVCERRFPRKDRLLTHYRTHTGEKPYQCQICQKRFSDYSSYSVHSRTHTGEKPYQCDVCKKCFSIHANLVKHNRIHTGLRPYECSVCESRFTQKVHLKDHSRTHTGEKPFKCEVCHKRFASGSRLKSHTSRHNGFKPTPTKFYDCDMCHSRFKDSSVLKTHLMTHTGEKPYECDICHKRCSQKSNLRTHIKSHSGEKYHKCHICHAGFTRNFTLQRHLRLHLI